MKVCYRIVNIQLDSGAFQETDLSPKVNGVRYLHHRLYMNLPIGDHVDRIHQTPNQVNRYCKQHRNVTFWRLLIHGRMGVTYCVPDCTHSLQTTQRLRMCLLCRSMSMIRDLLGSLADLKRIITLVSAGCRSVVLRRSTGFLGTSVAWVFPFLKQR